MCFYFEYNKTETLLRLQDYVKDVRLLRGIMTLPSANINFINVVLSSPNKINVLWRMFPRSTLADVKVSRTFCLRVFQLSLFPGKCFRIILLHLLVKIRQTMCQCRH